MKANLSVLAAILLTSLAARASASHLPPYYSTILMLAGINAVLAVSLNLVNGLSGQFSLGHAGFMAVGAYAAASVTTPEVDLLGLAAWGTQGPLHAQSLFCLALALAA